jgi:hypothetical protein
MAIRPDSRDELLKLPPEERQELADEPLGPSWERAWSEEIARRIQQVAGDAVLLVDADEMHRDLREELRASEE